MHLNYLTSIITEIYLIVFVVIILSKLNVNFSAEREVKELKNIIYSYLVLLCMNIFFILVGDNIIQADAFLSAIMGAILLNAILLCCYFWYRFVGYRLYREFTNQKIFPILMKTLLILIIAANLISIFTGWVFYIDDQGYFQYGKFFFCQMFGCCLYLFIPTICALFCFFQSSFILNKEECILYAVCMIPLLSTGIIQSCILLALIISLNIFLIIYLSFLLMQDNQIYSDALTGLYNRKRLFRFLEKKLAMASIHSPITIFLMDINNFKAINDAHGHLEGDNALKIVAEVIKRTASTFNGFAARYGGDEFCLVIQGSAHKNKEIIQGIKENICQLQYKKIYPITLSIGYITYTNTNTNSKINISEILNKVDSQLYKDKQKWHQEC